MLQKQKKVRVEIETKALGDDAELKAALKKSRKLVNKIQKEVVLDEVGQILNNAADFMKEVGWCRGTLMAESGRVCLLGAIIHHDGGSQSDYRDGSHKYAAGQRLKAYIRAKKWNRSAHVPDYNDNRCKSGKEAIQTLKEAATFKE